MFDRLVLALAAFVLTPALWAQEPAKAATVPASHVPSFEVATIKPVGTCASVKYLTFTPSGRMSLGCQPLAVLIRMAYLPSLQQGDVRGGPAWVESEPYDLVAKVDQEDVPGWSTMSEREQYKVIQPMLQHLLADRFHLKVHIDPRSADAYALVQAKGGAKLKEAAPPRKNEDGTGEKDSNGVPSGGFKIVNNKMTARAEELPNLLWFFAGRSGYEDAPAINKTGLDGFYDFEMTLPDLKDKAEFEHQMNVQLGLRMERQKVPLQTVVIDQADRPGVDN